LRLKSQQGALPGAQKFIPEPQRAQQSVFEFVQPASAVNTSAHVASAGARSTYNQWTLPPLTPGSKVNAPGIFSEGFNGDMQDEDGYVRPAAQVRREKKQQKHKQKAILGTGKGGTIATVPLPPARKALFLTRIQPTVTSEMIRDHVVNAMEKGANTAVMVTQLKTRHDGYNSFYVTVLEIEAPGFWPEDALFYEYKGSLYVDRLHESVKTFPLARQWRPSHVQARA
jgi:hypothetical protein